MAEHGFCDCGGELLLAWPSNMLTCGRPACEPRFLVPRLEGAS